METTQTFHEHILELRRRLFWVFVVLMVSGLVGFVLRNPLIKFLQKPLGAPLYYTTPAGSFNFAMNIAFIFALFVGIPIIIYQVVKFIEPAFFAKASTGRMTKIITASFSLAISGVVFGYYVIVPLSLHFFEKYSTAQLKPLISADSYLSYLLNTLFIFALIFQIPLIFLFINRIKPLKPKKLLHYQRHVIVGSLVIAIILPFTYDPISQFVVALPIIVLYYLSILLIWYFNRKVKATETNEPKLIPSTFETKEIKPELDIASELERRKTIGQYSGPAVD